MMMYIPHSSDTHLEVKEIINGEQVTVEVTVEEEEAPC